MQISIVVPLLNEQRSLKELYRWIMRVMDFYTFPYEIIFIDDGSTDGSWDTLVQLSQKNKHLKAIKFSKNFGKSQALHAGFKAAKGEVVITMDADLQDSPEEIPAMYDLIKKEGYQVVSGWKKKRYDALITKNMPSKLFNWAARKTSGLKLHDFNCGIKAFDREVIKTIEVSGEMHRYIPVLAKNAGFSKITEKVVQHRPRKYGYTKFGPERFSNGFLDLITLWFVFKFGRQPMHLFGALGVLMFIVGFAFAFYLGIDKLFVNPTGRLITDRPEFYLALTAMILGTQLFLAGFLGELLVRYQKKRPPYTIAHTINLP